MAMFSRTFNIAVPAADDPARDGDNEIRNFKEDFVERFGREHWMDSDGKDGLHRRGSAKNKFGVLANREVAASEVAKQGRMYWASDTKELWIHTASDWRLVAKDPATAGYPVIVSGIDVGAYDNFHTEFGIITIGAGDEHEHVVFSTAFSSDETYHLSVTHRGGDLWQTKMGIGDVLRTGFSVWTESATQRSFFWMATGY